MTIYLDAVRSADERAADLLRAMTLDEKLAQIGSFWIFEILDGARFAEAKARDLMAHGIGQVTRLGGASNVRPQQAAELANQIQKWLLENTRLKIPAVVHEECCSGLMAFGATVFPQAIGCASMWEPELVQAMTDIIRRQMRSAGAHHALAPVLDVARDARWGRVEETFGEDPYLVAANGAAYVRGLQKNGDLKDGVVATAKHFVGYSMSEGGLNWAPPHLGQRELHEVYLHPFEAAVREAGIGSVMNAYHEIDGVPCASNRELLTDILRGDWGFTGTVVSDYFAVNMLFEYHQLATSKAEAARQGLDAGIDVELPKTDCYGEPLRAAVLDGRIPESLVDTAVQRVLRQKFELGLFENPYVETASVAFDTLSDRAVARQIAEKSIVLLKNDADLLPLSKEIHSIAIIGPNADQVRHLFGDYSYPAHIQALLDSNTMGVSIPEGVTRIEDTVQVSSPREAIQRLVSPNTTVYYAQGCDIKGDSREGFAEAVKVARQADVAILVMGDKGGITLDCTSGEARDRADLALPGVQPELLRAVLDTGTPVVLVLVTGRPVTLGADGERVRAILEAWFPGEEGGWAIARTLFGDANPGGKLPVTFPVSVGQVPIYYGHKPSGGRSQWLVDYVETPVKPRYPFGFGLSYTRFSFANLRLDKAQARAGETITVQADITNTGARAGDEVAQLYIRQNGGTVTRPVKELKGFKRLTLQPGETRTVTFELPVNALAYYTHDMTYAVEPGTLQIMVGSSSDDIHLTGTVELVGPATPITDKAFFTAVRVS